MGNGVSQGITTTQFYLYGRSRFTRTGWEATAKAYKHKEPVEAGRTLDGQVVMVTGANSGIGFSVAQYLASNRATVYMVCRNRERGEAARKKMLKDAPESKINIVVGDCSLKADVERVVSEVAAAETKLDCLVCNAGALLNERTLTSEGVETTLACHLLYGSYHLATQAMPLLRKATEPRVVLVSSGGMYNTRLPSWERMIGTKGKYDGQMAYAYAKRGQVLLCERWTKQEQEGQGLVKFVSCHPGWVDTPGVTDAYGDQKKYLQPMRDGYQGSEGISWLCAAPSEELESGAFYLDRTPQRKHLGGPFFTDGSFTKNTEQQVDDMMANLREWCEQVPPEANS